jgi:O-6-methylguanine DNA methyltransferase
MSEFSEKVYNITKQVPKGMITTYGEIALQLGSIKLSRAVGNALHKNPNPIIMPCHRVVNKNLKLATNFGFGGMQAQQKLLESEGVLIVDDSVNKKCFFSYKDKSDLK